MEVEGYGGKIWRKRDRKEDILGYRKEEER